MEKNLLRRKLAELVTELPRRDPKALNVPSTLPLDPYLTSSNSFFGLAQVKLDEIAERMMQAMDADKDGVVTASELRKVHSHFI